MNADDAVFVDTNVLLYCLDSSDVQKQRSARSWVDELWVRGRGRLSWQVLNEFYASSTRKLLVPVKTVRQSVETYATWGPAGFTIATFRNAWRWMDQAGISYWDSLILASAEQLVCSWLLTEDLQHGRKYGSVQVISPFQISSSEFFRQPIQ